MNKLSLLFKSIAIVFGVFLLFSPNHFASAERLLFVSERDGNREIYIMNSDGNNETNLSNNQFQDIQPAWAPDGSLIVFASERNGINAELYTIVPGDINPIPQVITAFGTGTAGFPYWSPDSTKIAFSHEIVNCNADIYIVQKNGTSLQNLTNEPVCSHVINAQPIWSPSGQQIVFTVHAGLARLFIMNADGSSKQAVSPSDWHSEGTSWSPSWAPDGSRIAFQARPDYDPGNNHIAIMNTDGTGLIDLGFGLRPVWSPDGNLLVYECQDLAAICTIKPDGTNKTVIAQVTSGTAREPMWSPDQSVVVFVAHSFLGITNIEVVTPDGGGLTTPLTSSGQDKFTVHGAGPDYLQIWEPPSQPALKMIKPVDGEIICDFGCYIGENGKPHEGIDVDSTLAGTEVKAVATGKILRVDRDPDTTAGRWVWISHGDIRKLDGSVESDISTRYLHLDTVDPGLAEGQNISQGDIIGTVGNTGTSVVHLHFETRQGTPIPSNFRTTTALNPNDFVDYTPDPERLSLLLFSPADLVVIDPDGLVVSKTLNELSGSARYLEIDYFGSEEGEDIAGYDTVIIDQRKNGDYLINVISEPDALPTDVYTLKVTSAGTTETLAENILIADIPDQPYLLRSTEAGIEKIIPAKVRIEPETLNLSSEGGFIAFIQISKGFAATIQDIDTSTITISSAIAMRTLINQGTNILIAEFNRQDLVDVSIGDKVSLMLKGKLFNGTSIEGSDSVRVIRQDGF